MVVASAVYWMRDYDVIIGAPQSILLFIKQK